MRSRDTNSNLLDTLLPNGSGAQLPGPPPTADRSAQVALPNTTRRRTEFAVASSASAPCWAARAFRI
jgi:hypothetical protein